MYPHEHRQQPSILNMLMVSVLSLVILAFAGMALSTNDLLWFWPVFNEQPESISETLMPGTLSSRCLIAVVGAAAMTALAVPIPARPLLAFQGAPTQNYAFAADPRST